MREGRIQRVASELQQEIALIIHRELKDPRLGFVTVTRVQVSKDLSHAKVWYSCLGSDEERLHSQEVLEHSAHYVRGLIKKRFRLKKIPALHFHYDESIAGAIALNDAFDHLQPPPEPTSPGPAEQDNAPA